MSLRPSDHRLSPPPLVPADFQRLDSKLANARLRRRTTLEPLLQCKIDGQVKAEVDLRRESQSTPMFFSAGDDCLEVWANDVLLATYFLPDMDELEPGRTLEEAITLDGGQRVAFQCSLTANKEGELACRTLVRYRETQVSRMIARQWQRWVCCEWESVFRFPRLAGVLPLLAFIALSVFWWWERSLGTKVVVQRQEQQYVPASPKEAITNSVGGQLLVPAVDSRSASSASPAQFRNRRRTEGARHRSQTADEKMENLILKSQVAVAEYDMGGFL